MDESHAGPSSSPDDDSHHSQLQDWIREQETLKSSLILQDDFPWTLSAQENAGEAAGANLSARDSTANRNLLKYVGGVDLSFSKSNTALALGALVVLDATSLQVVYEDFEVVNLDKPYIPGFLAFRESPVLVGLLQKMAASEHRALYPQLLMVDGNGILHPRGFGLACHLGVLANIPTIGIGKNLHHVDGLTDEDVRVQASAQNLAAGDSFPLTGKSGHVWGLALKSHETSSKPIFVSIGHRISLHTAGSIVRNCCRYRVPEPVRQADIRSRERLRIMETGHN